jgi:hypothetical protein
MSCILGVCVGEGGGEGGLLNLLTVIHIHMIIATAML